MLHRYVFYDSAEVYNWHDGNKNNLVKNNLRTIKAQIVPKLTGSYKKKACSQSRKTYEREYMLIGFPRTLKKLFF